jgi:uncharacterized membrane-anchored protein YhcB (DUF1043 family)
MVSTARFLYALSDDNSILLLQTIAHGRSDNTETLMAKTKLSPKQYYSLIKLNKLIIYLKNTSSIMLEPLIMQVTGVEVQGLVQSVIALSTAVTAIGAIIAKFIQTHTNNQKLKAWADTVSKDLNETKKSLQATDQWVLENQSKFTTGMAAVNQILTAEQQKILAAQGINIDNLKKELDSVRHELTTIYSTVPAEKAAASTPTL